MKKSYYIYLFIGLLGVILLIPSTRNFVKKQIFPLEKVDQSITLSKADLDIQLKGINTPSLHLKDLPKDKLLFLNFWGTWCPPCVEEWGSIQKLYDEKKEKINFVLIAMLEDEEKVRAFITKNQYTAPVYLAESPLSERILPKVFPTTYLVDKNGRILKKETAKKDWNSGAIKTFIDHVSK